MAQGSYTQREGYAKAVHTATSVHCRVNPRRPPKPSLHKLHNTADIPRVAGTLPEPLPAATRYIDKPVWSPPRRGPCRQFPGFVHGACLLFGVSARKRRAIEEQGTAKWGRHDTKQPKAALYNGCPPKLKSSWGDLGHPSRLYWGLTNARRTSERRSLAAAALRRWLRSSPGRKAETRLYPPSPPSPPPPPPSPSAPWEGSSARRRRCRHTHSLGQAQKVRSRGGGAFDAERC